MRYVAKWRNGFWTLFDSVRYEPKDTFPSQIQADEAALSANETGKWRIMNCAEWWQ